MLPFTQPFTHRDRRLKFNARRDILWPQGEPKFVGSWRWRAAYVVAGCGVVAVALGLGEAGAPAWLAVPLGLAVGLAPIGIYVARSVFREAKRQGFRRDAA
jgi:hypothetical protein